MSEQEAGRSVERDVTPRCVAHGSPRCADCSRITLAGLTDDGDCRGCGTWGTDGVHWDTCPERIRGRVHATRAEALVALAEHQTRRAIRSILLDYARPVTGSGWGAVDETVDRIMCVTSSAATEADHA